MKTKLFLLLLLTTSICIAQDSGDVNFGFFVGPTLSSVSSNEDLEDIESKFGIHGGFLLEYFFSEQWSLKTKLYYDQKGFSNILLQETTFNFERGSIIFHNVTLPVMTGLYFGNNNQFYVNLGPYASRLLSAVASVGVGEQRDQFKQMDFGLEGGFGYSFSFSKSREKHYFIEYTTQYGFIDILEENEFDPVRNTRHSISLGFRF